MLMTYYVSIYFKRSWIKSIKSVLGACKQRITLANNTITANALKECKKKALTKS